MPKTHIDYDKNYQSRDIINTNKQLSKSIISSSAPTLKINKVSKEKCFLIDDDFKDLRN